MLRVLLEPVSLAGRVVSQGKLEAPDRLQFCLWRKSEHFVIFTFLHYCHIISSRAALWHFLALHSHGYAADTTILSVLIISLARFLASFKPPTKMATTAFNTSLPPQQAPNPLIYDAIKEALKNKTLRLVV